jgi:hypothetical protein
MEVSKPWQVKPTKEKSSVFVNKTLEVLKALGNPSCLQITLACVNNQQI